MGLIFTKGDLNEVRACFRGGAGLGWAAVVLPSWVLGTACCDCRKCWPDCTAKLAPLLTSDPCSRPAPLPAPRASSRPAPQVRKVINEFKVGAPARVGLVAPNDVTIPAGNTGMDPSQTSFFQVRSSSGAGGAAVAAVAAWRAGCGRAQPLA